VDAWADEELPLLVASGATVVASIWGRTAEEFGLAAERLTGLPIAALEVNVSCPNLHDGSRMFAHSTEATAAAVRASAACALPLWVKLSPGTPDLVAIAGAALDAGAAALVVCNTLPALAIDTETRRPVLGAGTGGLSGPALHPVAVRAVWDCARALPGASIIGVGGVMSASDAVELLLAGASAVEVGTATFRDPRAPWKVLSGLRRWCGRHGVRTVRELIGSAHA
jgi:dihydroorotate dehydrogenase (NAD+) catalytic subunit